MHGHHIGSLTIPLKAGTIGKITGLDEILDCDKVQSIAQYYYEGDVVKESYIGTLLQHFCRVKMMTDSIEEYKNLIIWINAKIQVLDNEGKDMVYRRFDINRLR